MPHTVIYTTLYIIYTNIVQHIYNAHTYYNIQYLPQKLKKRGQELEREQWGYMEGFGEEKERGKLCNYNFKN